MAYQRETKQELEVDFPLEDIWRAIPKAIAELQWELQEKDDETHYLQVKTKSTFLSYNSMLYVQASKITRKQLT
jgi:hypothetical protein